MFETINNSKFASDLPRNNSFSESDWRILAKFWHPIAFSHEIKNEPVKAKLLDVDLVIYRTSAGISVAKDICPHRGTKLSAGWISDDNLVCPMHGICYDHLGKCTKIPSVNKKNTRIPPRLKLQSLKVEERYGIVFACLSEDPIWPLPVWPGINNPKLKNLHFPTDTWHAAASRHVENFNDVAHFPWVHKETFGGYEDDAIADYEVEHTGYGLAFDLPYLEEGNRFPDEVEGLERNVIYRYELTFPFSTIIMISPIDSDYVQYFADTVCPVSAYETKIFQMATDTTGNPNLEILTLETSMINNEDKDMVEGQHPEDLPLDLMEEIHIPADRMSVEFRRSLSKKFGLGSPLVN